jgi:hypothetical protein
MLRKIVPVLALGGVVLALGTLAPAGDEHGITAEANAGAAPVEASAPRALTPGVLATSMAARPAAPAGLDKAVRTMIPSGQICLPRGWHSEGGAVDIVVHFHGTPAVFEGELERAGLRVASLTVNLGIGSGVYDSAFADPKALDRALAAILEVAKKAEPKSELRVGRVALSSWSAGYGAVTRILNVPKNAEAIDAVLLADGLHAAFMQDKTLDPVRMAPYTALAAQAAHGDKLFAITHSSIPTYSYANTTQTADYLLEKVGAARVAAPANVNEKMHATSAGRMGDFHVRGFTGMDKDAHCQHLRKVGDTLLPLLAKRWVPLTSS